MKKELKKIWKRLEDEENENRKEKINKVIKKKRDWKNKRNSKE